MKKPWWGGDQMDWQLRLTAGGIKLDRHLEVVAETRRAAEALGHDNCPNGCGPLHWCGVSVLRCVVSWSCSSCGFEYSKSLAVI